MTQDMIYLSGCVYLLANGNGYSCMVKLICHNYQATFDSFYHLHNYAM